MREKWTAVFQKKKGSIFLPFSFHLVLGSQVTFQTKKKGMDEGMTKSETLSLS